MSGVSDVPFRKLVKNYGAGLVVSEMIACRAMVLETRQSMDKLRKADNQDISVVQLAGCEPEVMGEAAKMNEDLGADVIDINFGCPVKKGHQWRCRFRINAECASRYRNFKSYC